jgi:hypothetical protein
MWNSKLEITHSPCGLVNAFDNNLVLCKSRHNISLTINHKAGGQEAILYSTTQLLLRHWSTYQNNVCLHSRSIRSNCFTRESTSRFPHTAKVYHAIHAWHRYHRRVYLSRHGGTGSLIFVINSIFPLCSVMHCTWKPSMAAKQKIACPAVSRE